MTTTLLFVLALSVAQGTNPDQGETREGSRSVAERVLASQLDEALPAIPLVDWIKTTLQTDREVRWVQTACPATNEDVDTSRTERPVCMLAIASRLEIVDLRRRQTDPTVSISIRLGTGNPNSGVWQRERPRVEDAFIEREGDSLSVPRLRDLPELLQLPPSRWPKAALSVVPEDIRCDSALPKPGDRVRCQATIRNRGSVEALARVSVGIVARNSDMGLGQELRGSTIRPNDQVVVSWDWVWPKGDAWSVSVSVDLHTPHGYGGYRMPMRERNVQDNRAYVMVPSRKSSVEARSVDSMLRIRGGELLAPTSAPVAPGRSYPFQVGHCGLLHVVDFSGSYWVVDETTLSAGERGQFGINANEGTMTLVDSETAVFRSGVGGEATLRRYVGVLERSGCF
jgi:hypothetical protein